MSGRRSHRRFQVRSRCQGLLRLVHAVQVIEANEQTIVLAGDAPAVVGETLVLDLHGPGAHASVPVRVESSRAVVIDGAVRHEIRVRLTGFRLASGGVEVIGDPVDDQTVR